MTFSAIFIGVLAGIAAAIILLLVLGLFTRRAYAFLLFFVTLVISVLVFIWRISVVTVTTSTRFLNYAVTYKVELITCILIYTAGVPIAEYQDVVQTGIDIAYEAGVRRLGEILVGFIAIPARDAWNWIAIRINDILLYIRDCIAETIELLIDINDFLTIQGVTSAYSIIVDGIICLSRLLISLPSLHIQFLTDVFTYLIDIWDCWVDLIRKFVVEVVRFTFFSEDCTMCSFPSSGGDPDNDCALRSMHAVSVVVNCSQCHNFEKHFVECAKRIVQFITLQQFNPQIDQMAELIVCILELWKRPFFIFIGLLDGPACIDPGDVIAGENFMGMWLDDIAECFDKLVELVTGGKIDDFFIFLFSKLIEVVFFVIDNVEQIVACFDSPTYASCLDSYPSNCVISGGVAVAGLQTCQADLNTCLAAVPLLANLTNIGGSFNLFSISEALLAVIDTVVCPVYSLIICFDTTPPGPDDFTYTLNVLTCIEASVPIFGPIAGALKSVLETFDTAIDLATETADEAVKRFTCINAQNECFEEAFSFCIPAPDEECKTKCFSPIEAFPCFFSCLDDGLSCFAKKRAPRDHIEENTDYNNFTTTMWKDKLHQYGVTEHSFCGSVLHSDFIFTLNMTKDYGFYSMYQGCFEMLVMGIGWKKSGYCDDMDELLSGVAGFLKAANKVLHKNHEYKRFNPTNKPNRTLTEIIPALNQTKSLINYIKGTPESPNMVRRIINYIKESKYYNLTAAFIEKSRGIKAKYRVSNVNQYALSFPNISQFDTVERMEIMDAYTTYANGMINHYQRNKKRSNYPNAFSIDVSSPNYLSPFDLYKNNLIISESTKDFFKRSYSDEIEKNKMFLNSAYQVLSKHGLESWGPFKKAHMMYTVFTQGKWKDLLEWSTGKDKEYLVERGFVNKMEYEAREQKREEDFENMIYTRSKIFTSFPFINGSDIRRERVFGPFLIEVNFTNIFPDIGDVFAILRNTRNKTLERMNRAKENKEELENQYDFIPATGDTGNEFDFDELTMKLFDVFIGFIVDSANFLIDKTKEFAETLATVDYEAFFRDEAGQFLKEAAQCPVPQAINGSDLYGPFCGPLLPEAALNFIQPVPNKVFPMQIPWSEELIINNCTTNFTGVQSPFWEFAFSDNCGDGQDRPLCPETDYCDREYHTCKELGIIRDSLDTVLFTLAVFPKWINFGVNGYVPIIEITLSVLPIVTSLVTAVNWFSLPAVYIIYTLLWLISRKLKLMTVGFILTALTAVIAIFIPSAITAYPMVFMIIGFFVILWIINLFVVIPFVEFNVISGLISATNWINESSLFFFIPDLGPLLARLNEFNYGSGPVPSLYSACYAANFKNFGFAGISFFGYAYLISLGTHYFLPIVLLIFDIILAFVALFGGFIQVRMMNEIDELTNQNEKLKSAMKRFKTTKKKIESWLKSNTNDVEVAIPAVTWNKTIAKKRISAPIAHQMKAD